MTIVELLTKYPKGEVITDKRILSALKRAGVIKDYSSFGYLEDQYVYYRDVWDYGNVTVEREMCHGGKWLNDGELGTRENPFPSKDAMFDAGHQPWVHGEYKGFKFESEYLDGCFCPYLVKAGGPCEADGEVHRRMSVWGAVV